jgi:hypothetical protein
VKFVALTLWMAVTLVVTSGFHQAEFHIFEQSYELPCVLREFEIRENITAYGFPFSWIAIHKGCKNEGLWSC